MTVLKKRLQKLQSSLHQAEQIAQRPHDSVQLLAVTKTQSATTISQAYQLGLRHFGENYLQEALNKQKRLAHYAITWHFIGPIQSNKTRQIAQYFSWVHSVDRLKIAKRLSEQRGELLPPLNLCLQVNISQETSKSGLSLEELPQVIAEVKQLPNIRLRGVMAIPAKQTDYQQQRLPYQLLYQEIAKLNDLELTTFSFGMSTDIQAAIVEGATIVRVGTDLFGARK